MSKDKDEPKSKSVSVTASASATEAESAALDKEGQEKVSNRKRGLRTMCNRSGANNNTVSTEISKKIMSQDGLSLNDAGRGSLSGYVRCSLCNVKSRKMYAYGRGFTAHLAAIHPNEDHVQAVLDSRATLTAPGMDKQGNKAISYMETLPPACLAAKNGKLDILKLMDSSSISVERDKFGANALDWAAGGGHLDCVEYLVPIMPLSEYNKQPIKRRDGKSCLHWGCRNGNIETTKYLLHHLYKTPLALATLGTGDGTTPLQLAAFGGNINILHYLYINYGPNANIKENIVPNLFHHNNTWGCYPEHFACMSPTCTSELLHFFVEIIYNNNFFLAGKAFFLSVNTEGMTPVHKWLLHIGKNGREIDQSLKYLLLMKNKLLEMDDTIEIPSPPDTIVTWIFDRITNQANIRDNVTDEEREGIKELMPSLNKENKKNYYTILNLYDNATIDEIKKSYKLIALKFHPDRMITAENWEKEAALNTFKRATEAYEILSEKRGFLT